MQRQADIAMNSLAALSCTLAVTLMKTPIFISFFLLSFLSVSAQVDKTDSLIKKIHNKQLRGNCHYVWDLEMQSDPGRELTKIGKTATNQLIGVLTDPNKGIIAHYILTNIWVDTIRQRSSFEHYAKDSFVHYEYNGLVFYERHNQWYSLKKNMEENKNKWLRILREKSNR